MLRPSSARWSSSSMHHHIVHFGHHPPSQIDAEKTPFLCDRLKIRTIPTVIMIKDSVTRGYIVGFTDLGNTDEFSTEMLAWRLGHVSWFCVINVVSCLDVLHSFANIVQAIACMMFITTSIILSCDFIVGGSNQLQGWSEHSTWSGDAVFKLSYNLL